VIEVPRRRGSCRREWRCTFIPMEVSLITQLVMTATIAADDSIPLFGAEQRQISLTGTPCKSPPHRGACSLSIIVAQHSTVPSSLSWPVSGIRPSSLSTRTRSLISRFVPSLRSHFRSHYSRMSIGRASSSIIRRTASNTSLHLSSPTASSASASSSPGPSSCRIPSPPVFTVPQFDQYPQQWASYLPPSTQQALPAADDDTGKLSPSGASPYRLKASLRARSPSNPHHSDSRASPTCSGVPRAPHQPSRR